MGIYFVFKKDKNGGGADLNSIKYLSAQEMSIKWGISKRRVQELCVNNRIPGAVRIGNMWAIPANASKPVDARIRKQSEEINDVMLMRRARKHIKSIVHMYIREFSSGNVLSVENVRTLVVIFAAMTLKKYIPDLKTCLNISENHFKHKVNLFILHHMEQQLGDFIENYATSLDDALSWVYQYAIKNTDAFEYKDTQFFTEKYMISTLVDSLDLNMDSKILDPACGGGNFLLYSFSELIKQTTENTSSERITQVLNNLYGYEIDAFLSHIASFNLKLKAVAIMHCDNEVTIEVFNEINTNIFYPVDRTVSGFLDTKWEDQLVYKCDSTNKFKLKDICKGVNVVVTNPPFRTIKGMPIKQKDYLREHYPIAKCDMCNAFILRVMEILPDNGKAAMVTQNSWMYLDSFAPLRQILLSKYTLANIWELGTNAFYDISGEKANVALITCEKKMPAKEHKIRIIPLKDKTIEQLEKIKETDSMRTVLLKQNSILKNRESRFDIVSTEHLKYLLSNSEKYREYAVPMQGTSTGDAKNLIDYYWNHLGDANWVLVSKGGGYSRFEGLNSYSVKWGKDGEYIRNTKGSALRNTNHFSDTQLVFSDTGTAGLNVRVLLPNQIFVASGPGIRITRGRTKAHLAFLNSRIAAFFVRLASPKLTIAARYIGQVPVTESLLNSPILEKCADNCLRAKTRRLSKRPYNIEFIYIKHSEGSSLLEKAIAWFKEDLIDEWTQLEEEQLVENIIAEEFQLTNEDQEAINNFIGRRIVHSTKEERYQSFKIKDMSGILNYDCLPKRTKANKKAIGTDGIIEYISQAESLSCEIIYKSISEKFDRFVDSYISLYLHALIVSAMEFRELRIKELTVRELLFKMGISDNQDIEYTQRWLEDKFNIVHKGIFKENPLFEYYHSDKLMALTKGEFHE